MSEAIANLQAAQARALAGRPSVGGFPYLAETLRSAGVTRNIWQLPACQSLYLTKLGAVIQQGTPLASGSFEVPRFDRQALIMALLKCHTFAAIFSPRHLLRVCNRNAHADRKNEHCAHGTQSKIMSLLQLPHSSTR